MRLFWPIASVVLLILCITTNLWWFSANFDLATILKARDQQYYESCSALKQALEVMPSLKAAHTVTEIVPLAAQAAGDAEPYEKEGFIWVGFLGYQFGPDGGLDKVVPTWEPFDCP